MFEFLPNGELVAATQQQSVNVIYDTPRPVIPVVTNGVSTNNNVVAINSTPKAARPVVPPRNSSRKPLSLSIPRASEPIPVPQSDRENSRYVLNTFSFGM